MRIQQILRFRSDRGGTSAMIFALSIIPLMGGVALAIDFAGVTAAKTKLEAAADAGLLAAITTAANAVITNPDTYLAVGTTAGMQRFLAQAGQAISASTPTPVLTLTRSGPTIVGTATWDTTYNTFLGSLLGMSSWPISGTATASIPVSAPFLNVEIMLDNSPSMEIGATDADIATLQQLTACSASGAWYLKNVATGGWGQIDPSSEQPYNAYKCSGGGHGYTGNLACPIPGYNVTSSQTGPSCDNLPLYNGHRPKAGAPCAFACHFDTSKPAGTGSDYFAVARSTIGQDNQVTLRFDQVKTAVNTLITTMQSANLAINNLKVGVFTFDSTLQQVYPASGEAGGNWAAAIAAVGAPPDSPNQPDTGIQPYGGGNTENTNVPDTMNDLATHHLTSSGDGTSAASPRKVLFIVTDGVEDYRDAHGQRYLQAFDPAHCQTFKAMGYAVYVVYTPYYPLMNDYYLENMTDLVEGTGPGTVSYNLRACASSADTYIAASNGAALQAALQTFLRRALVSPARFTR